VNSLLGYTAHNWQPLSGLFIGIALIALYLYLYLTRHRIFIPLIARHVFRNQLMSEKSAEGLFNVVTSYMFAIGGILIILALFYLTNG
jgi:hypothetical protein